MTTGTKLILLGMAVVVVLGVVLQSMIAGYLEKQMGSQSQLLSPDEAAKLALKKAVKDQKKFEAKNATSPAK
ncbi:MAG: hypothetical protein KGS72_10090 [Cyanobacteria bacterium REEB67]|nr:hypothetical protein [Cyanobacteria bacterium REEB67]